VEFRDRFSNTPDRSLLSIITFFECPAVQFRDRFSITPVPVFNHYLFRMSLFLSLLSLPLLPNKHSLTLLLRSFTYEAAMRGMTSMTTLTSTHSLFLYSFLRSFPSLTRLRRAG
jgi:hypothetical protein